MTADFATSKAASQEKTLLVAIGVPASLGDTPKMGKNTVRRPRRQNPQAYIGQWIRAFGLKPAEVARAAEVNEGYLSQLISGEKKNPSVGLLMDLARAMPQPFHYTQFYQPPPDDAA